MLNLDERTVRETLDGLAKKHLVMERSGFGSRVPKYQHRFCNTGFGTLEFTPIQTAIVCELLLRGPQTPGELRTRASRMAEVKDGAEIDAALEKLSTREDGPFVVRLPREANRRDSRYAHLFSGPVQVDYSNETQEAAPAESRSATQGERIEKLEHLVAELRRELEEIKSKVS